MRNFKSILDEVEAQMLEQGHTGYRTKFEDDRALFNLPPEMKLPTIADQTKSTSPVGGRNSSGPKTKLSDIPNDANKQLKLPGSSTIQQAAYWPTKEYLIVSFKSGHSYSYDGVPVGTVMSWEKASSAGSWFYYNIRMSFKYQKMG